MALPRRFRLLLVMLAAVVVPAAHAHAQFAPVVVELFTSQGCSSCPPADAVLARLARRPGIVALSFHVDYWDGLGWKDPFASPANTQRQQNYRRPLGVRQIYTPQMVIGGAREMPGQSLARVEAAISDVAAKAPRTPDIALTRGDGGGLAVAIGAAAGIAGDVNLAVFTAARETSVRRGENGGRTLTNVNVVRKFTRLGAYNGAAIVVETAPAFVRPGEGVAVWIQLPNQGHIVAAAQLAPAATAEAE